MSSRLRALRRLAPAQYVSLLRWAFASAVLACILAGAIRRVVASVVAHDVVRCDRELRAVTEPAGWRAWPEPPELAGYRVEGEAWPCVGHGLLCGLKGAQLRDDGVCPEAGVPLERWFDPRGIYGSVRDVHVHASGGTFVVSAFSSDHARPPTPEAEVFVGAFQPAIGVVHRELTSMRGMISAILLALGLAGVLAAGIDGWRRMARASTYADPVRFRPARRDVSNAIALDDDSLPAIRAGGEQHPGHRPPGSVLVRVVEVTDGNYREPPSAKIAEVVEGDAAAQVRKALVRGRANLRRAFAGGLLLLAATLLVEVCVAVSEFRLD
jgi:hypothetical protein